MSLRVIGFAALLLTALGLVMGGAHLLELPAWLSGFCLLLHGLVREAEKPTV